jgi:hypothetical protein
MNAAPPSRSQASGRIDPYNHLDVMATKYKYMHKALVYALVHAHSLSETPVKAAHRNSDGTAKIPANSIPSEFHRPRPQSTVTCTR